MFIKVFLVKETATNYMVCYNNRKYFIQRGRLMIHVEGNKYITHTMWLMCDV